MTLIGHSAEISAGRFNYKGNLVVSGSMDGTMRLWSTDSGTAIAVFRQFEVMYNIFSAPNNFAFLQYNYQIKL